MYIYVQTGISVVIAIQALYTMYIILDMFFPWHTKYNKIPSHGICFHKPKLQNSSHLCSDTGPQFCRER